MVFYSIKFTKTLPVVHWEEAQVKEETLPLT